jgi:hypothetical protein
VAACNAASRRSSAATRSSASTLCNVNTYFDVSIAIRFSSIGRLLGWLLDSPTLASKAAGPSTPTARLAAMGTRRTLSRRGGRGSRTQLGPAGPA